MDVSTGEFFATELDDFSSVCSEIQNLKAREVVVGLSLIHICCAIHSASFMSVFRPGTFLLCWGLANIKLSSESENILKSGTQYWPVLSKKTCVT